MARSLAVQLAWSLSPAEHWWASGEPEWLAELPHQRKVCATKGALYEFGRHDAQGVSVVVAVASSPEDLPGACRVVVDLSGAGARVVRHPNPDRRGAVTLDLVSREQCHRWARRIHADATADGIVAPHSGVPSAVELGPLLRQTDAGGRGTLACETAVSASGSVVLDLVADGPHAVVGGTTGSGKSELLIAWVLAMAAPRSPADVTFLLVDFKGGSAFAALARLPHTVGIITDLDQAGARRALESLRAELRFRERLLVREGVRSIDETTACARLVIVVDEFAAMLAEYPELHALFSDLAARGRSLGIHLVLCTQRPAGVVRDSVLANADLRVSLRVNNRADSTAVVGSDAAAAIPPHARGRAIVSRGGESGDLVQFALANTDDIDRISQRWSSAPV
ncbi:MAG: FtsK/SpoIIIE domain-containing protein, partial [Rhodoglobus sp.]|nr:FtsK/SpoIIIE domain-containing protein [Rhodoglobus sp.]